MVMQLTTLLNIGGLFNQTRFINKKRNQTKKINKIKLKKSGKEIL